jgi:hypothetical protein
MALLENAEYTGSLGTCFFYFKKGVINIR